MGRVEKYYELKNATIGSGNRKPSGDTILYYEFDGNMNDMSDNNRNLSMDTGSFSYSSLQSGAKYVQTNSSSYSTQISIPFNRQKYTISFFCSFDSGSHGYNGGTVFELFNSQNDVSLVRMCYYWRGAFSNKMCFLNHESLGYVPSVEGSWHYYTVTLDGTEVKLYVDGNLVGSTSVWSQDLSTMTFRINSVEGSGRTSYAGQCKLSEFIIEEKVWSAGEISAYINHLKLLYGIS